MSDITPTQELDCRKMNCPLPVLKTEQAISSMAVGDILKMTATDEQSLGEMKNWIKKSGHQLLEASEEGGVFCFLVKKAH